MLAIGLSSALVPIYDKRNMKEPIMKLLPGLFILKNFWPLLI